MSEMTTPTIPDLTAAFTEPRDEPCGHEGCDKHLSDFKDLRGFRAHQRSHMTTICENCENTIAGVAYASHLKWCLENNPPQPIDIEPWRDVDVSDVLPSEGAEALLEALRRAGINTVAEVLEHPRSDFTAIPGWNDELTGQLRAALAGFDLKLPIPVPVLKKAAPRKREPVASASPAPTPPDPLVTDALTEVSAPLTALKSALLTEQGELEQRLLLVKGQLVRLDQAERALSGRSTSSPRPSTPAKPKRRQHTRGRPPQRRLDSVLEDVRANGPSAINDVASRLRMTKGVTTKALETLRDDEKLRIAGSQGNSTLYAVMEGAEHGTE